MQSEQIQRALHTLATQTVPDDLDLWPSISVRLEQAIQRHHVREHSRRRTRRMVFPVALFMALVLPGLMLMVPAANAAVSQMLQRFGLVLVDPQAAIPVPHPDAIPVAPPVVQRWAPQYLSREEAQAHVPFPIQLPTVLPPGFTLQGMTVGTGGYGCSGSLLDCKSPVMLMAVFRVHPDADAHVTLDIIEGKAQGGYAVSEAAVHAVEVNGRPATYVRGVWDDQHGWQDDVDAVMVSWEGENVTYLLHTYQLGLSRDEILRIAASVR